MIREYNYKLIGQLKSDHKKIFKLSKDIYSLFHKKDSFEEIREKLDILKSMLIMHLNFEDAILYPYLIDRYRLDGEKLSFIQKSSRGMENLSEISLKFIEECSNEELYRKHKDRFKKELKDIGELLLKRVKFEEEKLYPLYK